MATYKVGDVVKVKETLETGRIVRVREGSLHQSSAYYLYDGDRWLVVYDGEITLASDKETLAWRLTK